DHRLRSTASAGPVERPLVICHSAAVRRHPFETAHYSQVARLFARRCARTPTAPLSREGLCLFQSLRYGNATILVMDDDGHSARDLKKETGVTPAERYLKALCDGTFLSLWSFPRIYRDQGKSGVLEKEVCDLLVVFGNHVLIFSDKACAFPKHDDISVA